MYSPSYYTTEYYGSYFLSGSSQQTVSTFHIELVNQFHHSYPFVETYYIDPDFNVLFEDLVLTVDREDLDSDNATVKLTYAKLDSGTIELEFSNNSSVVIDTSSATKHHDTTYGNKRCIQWEQNEAHLTVVFNLELLNTQIYDSSFNLSLAGRSVQIRSDRVTQINQVDLQGNLTAVDPSDNKVRVFAGYNIDFRGESGIIPDVDTADRDIYPRNELILNAIPGAGLGQKESDCSELDTPKVRRINGTGADEYGNFLLNGEDCYWLSPVKENSGDEYAAGSLIRGDCTVCTSCDDFATAFKRLKELYDRSDNLATRYEQARSKYQELVSMLETFKDELSTLKFDLITTQTATSNFSLRFWMQTGDRYWSQVDLTVNYKISGSSMDSADREYVTYSGVRKYPTQAAVQANFSPGTGFTSDFNSVTDTQIGTYEYAYWQWSMGFDVSSGTNIDIEWTADLAEVDDQGNSLGTVTKTGTKTIQVS